ncbi:MAG TPA: Hpt domain-containing protein, partial [Candidatus Binatus sp.]|nr:Hpt domain-containing protein [Candidatus Binatus sp.]
GRAVDGRPDEGGRTVTAQLPLVDLDVVAELRDSTGGDMDFVRELVQVYVEEGAGHVAALDAGIAAGDVTALVRPAHTLKSSSASVGAMRLSELCRTIEATSRAGTFDGQAERVAEVGATWEATLTALRAEGLAP